MASLVLVSNRNESNTDIQLRTSANYLTRGTTHHLTCDLVIVLVPDAHIWIDVVGVCFVKNTFDWHNNCQKCNSNLHVIKPAQLISICLLT